MRRRLAVTLICAGAGAAWFWFLPEPPRDLPARLISQTPFPVSDSRIGGLSGLELSSDGRQFVAATDKGHALRGQIDRQNGEIASVVVTDIRPFLDKHGNERPFPFTDAEGLALDPSGRLYVSFEHVHRILFYDTPDSAAQWPSYTREWRALPGNKGLEALALTPEGLLITITETVDDSASGALVYTRAPHEKWKQPFVMPVNPGFAVVGADFGPDDRLYVLERGLYPFGFYSRVRSMRVTATGVQDLRTILQTPLGRHGNLEGISVWRDDQGRIRLTLLSDDNFYFFMRGDIVEYVLDDTLASEID